MQTARMLMKPAIAIPSQFTFSEVAAPWDSPQYWDFEDGLWRVFDATPEHLFVSPTGDAGTWEESDQRVYTDLAKWGGAYYLPQDDKPLVGKVSVFADLFPPPSGAYPVVYEQNTSAGYLGHAATDDFLLFLWVAGALVRFAYTTDGATWVGDYFDNGDAYDYGEIYTIGSKAWISSAFGKTLSFTVADGLQREYPAHLPMDLWSSRGALAYDGTTNTSHSLRKVSHLAPESYELIYAPCRDGAYLGTPTNLADLVAMPGNYISDVSIQRPRLNALTDGYFSWSDDKTVFFFTARIWFLNTTSSVSTNRRYFFLSQDGGSSWVAEDVTSRVSTVPALVLNPSGTRALAAKSDFAIYVDIS